MKFSGIFPFVCFALVVCCAIVSIFTMSAGEVQNLTPEPIFGPIDLPKAPHWDAERQCMFFVSVYESTVHKYVPSTKTHTSAQVGDEPMAFIIPLNGTDDKFIVSYGPNLAVITWDGSSPKVESVKIWRSIGENVYRANEGKVSPSGSLFVGTHSPFKADKKGLEMNQAELIVFSKSGESKVALKKVTVGNGMAWSKDHTMFYFIDSLAYTVSSYAYNIKDDSLGSENVLLNLKDANIPGVPDGMAIDDQDKLWVTTFEGYQIIHLDPETRSIIKRIPLDAFQVTSVVFAGPNLDDFFVTTGRYQMNSTGLKTYPHSGYIFERKNFEVAGRPGVPFDLT